MTIKKSLAPTSLRLILVSLMVAIVGLMAFGFIYSYKQLSAYAVEVSHTKTDAAASEDSLQALQNIQFQLQKDKTTIERSQNITSTGVLPQFEAINDVKAYAARNNLAIKSIDLADASGTSGAAGSTPTTPVATAKANTVDVTVNFGDEVNYKDFLQFIADVENSIPKMQIQGVTISPGSSANTVKTGPLTVHMYIN